MAFITRTDYPLGTVRNACYLCNANRENEVIIDPEVQIDFEGYMMFCAHCVADMAKLLGMATQEEIAKANALIKDLEEAYTQLKIDYSIAEDALTSLTRYNDKRTVQSPSKEK